MEKLKKKRTALRSSFTKTANILKVEVVKPAPDVDTGILIDRLTKLDNIFNEIKILNDNILDGSLDSNTPEELDLEIEDTERYSDQYIIIKRIVNEILSGPTREANTVNSINEALGVSKKGKHYKLPKLNIPINDGTLINYLSFWSQFKKIHEDSELEDCDKFQYLLQSVQQGTRARELLGSYPLTSENYSKAVAAFQERFGKKELLVEVYVRELLKLIISNVRTNGKDRLPLPDLFMVEAYLRSLESMDLDVNANATWLFPMVESSLREDTLKAWQRSPLFTSENVQNSRLSNLLEFLRREVEGEERLQLARRGFESSHVKEYKEKLKVDTPIRRAPSTPTVANFYTVKEQNCVFCEKAHDSKDCYTASSMPLKEKIIKLKHKKCCLKCFKPSHIAKDCRQFVRCHVCHRAHPVIFCPDLPLKEQGNVPVEKKSEIVQSTVANQVCSSEIALMTLEVVISANNITRKVRTLLDCGSQKSYILKSTAIEMGLSGLSTENISHTLFGGARTDSKCHTRYPIQLSSPNKYLKDNFELEFLDQDIIYGNIPCLPKGPLLKELKKHRIWLSDIGPGFPKIELLIGSDIYGKILTGKIKQLSDGLTAIETKLGWTVCGQLENPHPSYMVSCNAMSITNLAIQEMKVHDLWKLETIGILDHGETISKAEEEEMAQEQFAKELSRKEDGRYCVGLPWIHNQKENPSNRNIAEKRLFSVTRRLKVSDMFEDYNKVFQELLEEGIIEKVPNAELNSDSHYLPHHPVIKSESLTTKIRPVFDASCKTGRAPSLNDCLITGPNLIEQIPSILLRFREKCIGVIADIRKAFLQIEINKKDRDYLRFLWWENHDTIKVFRHNRVVFSARCSPFLLGGVLRHHLANAPENLRQVTDKLLKAFYIDNCVSSVDNVSALEDFMETSTQFLAEAKMDLRMWDFGPTSKVTFNDFSDMSLPEGDLPTVVPVLGLKWDKTEDCLMISNRFELNSTTPTKREILSLTQSIFDPIGFLAPVLLLAKVLIQEAWASKANWDAPLPNKIRDDFGENGIKN